MVKRPPVTRAIRALRDNEVEFTQHVFDYSAHPGAVGAAEALDVDPHVTVKTIVFATSDGDGVVVLMHGDLEVSTKATARDLGVKSVRPATQDEAGRWTGYLFGGTSPFGMRTELNVLVQNSLMDLERIYINAGSRGFLVGMSPDDVVRLTSGRLVDVATG